MIFALRQPEILAGLVVGFLVGSPLRAVATRWAAGAAGRRRLRPAGPRIGGGRWRLAGGLRGSGTGWSAYFDPYGTIGAVLAGAGWGPRPDPVHRRPAADVRVLLAAVAAHAALAAAGFAGFVAAGGGLGAFRVVNLSAVLHGSVGSSGAELSFLVGFAAINFACAVLALVPIPPLELGVVLWRRLPRSPGARRVAFHLLEEQWGVALVLLLLLLPLAGQQPLLLWLVDVVAGAVLPHF